MNRSIYAIVACASLLGGCAKLPDVKIGHYLPQGVFSASVVRTVGCATRQNRAGPPEKKLFAAATASMKMAFSRDPDGYKSISIKQFGSDGKSATLGFTYYDDGRLKGMNSTVTGNGQEIVEAAVKLVGIVLGITGPGVSSDDTPACLLIAEQAPKDFIITMTYSLSEPFDPAIWTQGKAQELKFDASPSNPSFSLDIDSALPTLCALIGPVNQVEPLAGPVTGNGNATTSLALRQPAEVRVQIVQESGAAFLARRRSMADINAAHPCGTKPELLSAGVIQVPQLGKTYNLPIPKGALFGTSQFEMSLGESGALTSVKYGNTSGAPATLSSAGAIAGMFIPDDASVRAGKKKADADLIYQQQRLVRCQMDPTTCPKE